MKIKEISVSCRKSHNYNSFETALTAELDDNEDIDNAIRALQAKCRRMVGEELKLEGFEDSVKEASEQIKKSDREQSPLSQSDTSNPTTTEKQPSLNELKL